MSAVSFIPGQVYNRRLDIHDRFGGQQQGGIITPANHNVVIVITGDQGLEHGYADKFDVDGSLLYFGEGQYGDMQFVRGNKQLRDHHSNGKTLYAFRSERAGLRFLGEFRYVTHETVTAPDTSGTLRQAIRFRLEPALPGGLFEPAADAEIAAEQSLFASNAAFRQCVEHYSMQIAIAHFQSHYTVEDVHSSESFDLLCRSGDKLLRVEVKGTTTSGQKVLMTGNEVRLALDGATVLFVVRNIQVSQGALGPRASGGDCLLFSPFQPSPGRVQPITCSVDLRGVRSRPVALPPEHP